MSEERFTIFDLEEWLADQSIDAENKGNMEDSIKFRAAATAVQSIINKIISRIQEDEVEEELAKLTPHLCDECDVDDDDKIKH